MGQHRVGNAKGCDLGRGRNYQKRNPIKAWRKHRGIGGERGEIAINRLSRKQRGKKVTIGKKG